MQANVGIREAKANFSKYLKLVKSGQEVVITERGRPIGKIVPLGKDELSLDERVKKLEEYGVLEPAKKTSKNIPPVAVPGKSAQKYLQEDRGL